MLLALADPPARQAHRRAWSRFRRRHQAVAKQGHTRRRARSYDPAVAPPMQTMAAAPPDLTDAHWQQIERLLPPDTATGRPPRAHRTVLAGILWVMRTGAGWQHLPAAFGPGATVQRRYRRWCENGTWPAILEIVMAPSQTSVAKVSL